MNTALIFAIALAVCLGVTIAAPTTFEFALVYQGDCTHGDNSYECVSKAGTQNLITSIQPDGTVHFEDKHAMGSTSLLSISGRVLNHIVVEAGNLTFGTSQSHNDNMIFLAGSAGPANHEPDFACGSVAFNVTGGTGRYAGAVGSVALQGCESHQHVRYLAQGVVAVPQ